MRYISQNSSETAPPLSKAVVYKDTIYVSGQVPMNLDTGEFIDGDIQDETFQTLENVASVLDEAGSSIDDVLKVTLYIDDIDTFDAVDEIYGDFFDEPYPSRTAFEVADLAVDVGIEIDVIAAL